MENFKSKIHFWFCNIKTPPSYENNFCLIESLAIKECGACPYIYWPVCASDGNFYDNKCLMELKACETEKKLYKMEDSYCSKY